MNTEKPTHAERPNTIPWPPILYGCAILGGWLLGHLYPLPFLPRFLAEMAFMLGLILIVTAIFIDVRTYLELRNHKTTILPTKGAAHLVTSGPFSFSRNPIYLSNTLLTFGIGLASANIWLFGTGIIAAFATHNLAILREEKHLTAKFGNEWRKYAKRVRRWI